MKMSMNYFKDLANAFVRVHFMNTFNNDPKTILARFDRMPLPKGDYQNLSRQHQYDEYLTPEATHKITFDMREFDIEDVEYFLYDGKRWGINDYQILEDVGMANLYCLGKNPTEEVEEDEED